MIDISNNINVSDNSANSLVNKLQNNTLKKDAELKAVCDDFESYFMQQMLDISMKSTTIAGEGVGSEVIKGLYTENVAKASSGSLGISDMLYRFISENQNG